MLGKPEWFGRRKYTGWGLTPRTWQGWAYILVFVAPLVIIQSAGLSPEVRFWSSIIWAVIFVVDFIDIMRRLPKDEREIVHEAIAERNALWAMIIVLAVGVAFQVAQSVVTKASTVDPVILVALIGATIAKAVTNWYLDKKD